jgi:hypothetical protein
MKVVIDKNLLKHFFFVGVLPATFPLVFKFVPILILPHLLWWNLGALPVVLVDKFLKLNFIKASEFGVVLTSNEALQQIVFSGLLAIIWMSYIGLFFYLKNLRNIKK